MDSLDGENSRFLYTAEQQCALENYFRNNNKYPDKKTRLKLQKELGIPMKKLQIWFQNRRARQKKIDRKVLGIAENPLQRMRLTLTPQMQFPLKFQVDPTFDHSMVLLNEDSYNVETSSSALSTVDSAATPSGWPDSDAEPAKGSKGASVLEELLDEIKVYEESSNDTWNSNSSYETEADWSMFDVAPTDSDKYNKDTMATNLEIYAAVDPLNMAVDSTLTAHDQEVPTFSQPAGSLSSITDSAWFDMKLLQNTTDVIDNYSYENDVFLHSPTLLDFGTFFP